jgi:type II secretory pathway pseudopilin PulG
MRKTLEKITLVELTLVFSIVGSLGAMTVPDYVVAAQQAEMQSKASMTTLAKQTYDQMIRQDMGMPSVATLAAYLPADYVRPHPGGISLTVDGQEVDLPTYANSECTQLTQNTDDKVACVGSIPS